MQPTFWSRVREARLVRVTAVYLAASWLILQATSLFIESLDLPRWFMPAAIILLGIGLLVISATAWVQSHPSTTTRAATEEGPGAWEIDLGDMKDSVTRGRLPHLTWARAILGGVVAFSLLFGLAGVYGLLRDRGQTSSSMKASPWDAAPGIAVLPFSVRGAGVDVWREGMVDVLSTNLDGIAGLRAIDSRTVLARWREQVPGTEAPDLQTSLEVARRAGARYAVIGSALATGSDIRFAAKVHDLEGGRDLGEGEAVGPADSVLPLVNRLSVEVLQTVVKEAPGELARVDLTRVATASVPALKAYLGGEALFRRSDFEAAIPLYKRAVEADSTFALAFFRLGQAYSWAEGIASDEEAGAIQRAARLGGRLSDRDAVLVRAALALDRGQGEALELLQQAVRRYPDDIEAWYLLGDAYDHLGRQVLARWEEEEPAFARAVALDSTFTPAYIHPIEAAFERDDSVEARRLTAVYSRFAGGSRHDVANRLALELAFGDSAARTRAGSALEAQQGETLDSVWFLLAANPRLFRLAEDVITLAGRKSPGERAHRWELSGLLAQGRLAAALDRAADPLVPPSVRQAVLYAVHSLRPSPAVREPEALAPTRPEDEFDVGNFYAGAYAADLERWPQQAAVCDSLRADAARLLAVGDTAGSRFMQASARALEGYALWRRAQRDAAIRALEGVLPGATGYGPRYAVNQTIRFWLGQLYLEAGRPRDAARCFESLQEQGQVWPALLFLGRSYEAGGEPHKARRAYELFAIAWKDADPELQPMVQEARAAVQRLTSVVRE